MDTENSIEVVDPAPEEMSETHKAHSVAVHLLMVLAAVILLVTSVNVWVDRAACIEGFRRVCLADRAHDDAHDGAHRDERGSDTSADGELTSTAS